MLRGCCRDCVTHGAVPQASRSSGEVSSGPGTSDGSAAASPGHSGAAVVGIQGERDRDRVWELYSES